MHKDAFKERIKYFLIAERVTLRQLNYEERITRMLILIYLTKN